MLFYTHKYVNFFGVKSPSEYIALSNVKFDRLCFERRGVRSACNDQTLT